MKKRVGRDYQTNRPNVSRLSFAEVSKLLHVNSQKVWSYIKYAHLPYHIHDNATYFLKWELDAWVSDRHRTFKTTAF